MKKGTKQTEKSREKIRLSLLGKHCSPKSEWQKGEHISPKTEFKKGQVSWNKGKPMTEEQKIKLSISHKGQVPVWKGQKFTEEHKKKLSDSHKGYVMPLEQRKKISLSNIGKNHGFKEGYISGKLGKTWEEFYGREKSLLIKEKIKEARLKQIFPSKDTTIEVKIQNFLKELKIDFFTHYHIKEIEHHYRCDILIPNMNLVIECDGNYWHKYPTRTEIDNIRTSELISQGFKVLRLWGNEIKNLSLEEFKVKVGGGISP